MIDLKLLFLFVLLKPITAVFLNTTIIGVELLVKNDPTIPDDQKYITSYVSTPTVDVRFGRHPSTVRNASLITIIKEKDWIAHRKGLHNKSCIDGKNTFFIPGCEENDIDNCETEGIYTIPLPVVPGNFLIVAYSHNGSRLPYYLDNYGSMFLELEYLKQANLTNTLEYPHRGNASMLCYQDWLRPPENTTSLNWIFLGNHMNQIGNKLTRIYNAPSFWSTAPKMTLLEGGARYKYRIYYNSGVYLRSTLILQTLSNCFYNVQNTDTGGIWSQTTMLSNIRQMRMLTINDKSDFGRTDVFIIREDNRSAHVDIEIYASNNLHQSKYMNKSCEIKHWITPENVYNDAIWTPSRLTSTLKRDYQSLPIDGVTPHIQIPLIIIGIKSYFYIIIILTFI